MSMYGPAETINHPDQSWPRDVHNLGPGANMNYHGMSVDGMLHTNGSNPADATAFGGNGPTAANTRANHHYAADVSDHVEGDFGHEELMFRSKRSTGSENNQVHPDPRRQMTANNGLTALNYINNYVTRTAKHLARMTPGEAADQMRFIGPLIVKEGTALQQGGGNGVAELAATIKGQTYGPNIWMATTRQTTVEGSALWMGMWRAKRKEGQLFDESWVRAEDHYDVPHVSKDQMAMEAEDKAIEAARVVGAQPVPAALTEDNAYERMYTEMLEPTHPKCTRSEMCPEQVWDPMCQHYPDEKKRPLYWHFWVPIHSPTGSPPDASINGFNPMFYVGHFQHAMRGDSVPTQQQVQHARDVVFPKSRNQDYRESLGKLDRIEYFVRCMQP